MVSGLPGAFHGHSHFFRDFAKMMRAEATARNEAPLGGASDDSPPADTAAAEADETDAATEEDEDLVNRLKSRNSDVLAHEASHLAGAGAYAKGGASYTYQIGPDGKPYAIGGEVNIDMTAVPGNPRATIAKMMAIRAAAMAPDDPSPEDAAVASAAAEIEAQARTQLKEEQAADSNSALRTAADRYAQPPASTGTVFGGTA
jgi:hypothetical protein